MTESETKQNPTGQKSALIIAKPQAAAGHLFLG
jgi:hypothetical protein